MKLVISSAHGKYVAGASGYLDEVTESRRIVEQVATNLRIRGVEVITFHDDTSKDVDTNLATIVNYHNAQGLHDADISFHLNAYKTTDEPKGVEVYYQTQPDLADRMSAAIAAAGGLKDRGPKYGNLYFLSNTKQPALLVEVCFVDSSADAQQYNNHFHDICLAIANLVDKQQNAPKYERPVLALGNRGSEVGTLQMCLGLAIDGLFGSTTELAVELYQDASNLGVDGVCGAATWAQLDRDYHLPVYPPPALRELPADKIEELCEIAKTSEASDYSWQDRGQAPDAYVQGMAFAYSVAYRKLLAKDPIAILLSQANSGDQAHDALAWYSNEFVIAGMNNSTTGVDTLRHLFVLLFGLGMRESSGVHCEGRDMSADNVTSETAEAGLFQASANMSACSTDVRKLFDEYTALGDCQQDGLGLFAEDVFCSEGDWDCYGSGNGYAFQKLTKNAPVFACLSTAVGLRYLRQHWGPINRREVEVRQEVDAMLLDIQAAIDDATV